MSQCHQEISENIEYLQSIIWDQSIHIENQFDLIFLDHEVTPKIHQPLTYPIGYQYDGTIKKINQHTVQDESEFTLVEITTKQKTPEKIRDHYWDLQEYGGSIALGKALEKGAKHVRKYYNDKNLRKRMCTQ